MLNFFEKYRLVNFHGNLSTRPDKWLRLFPQWRIVIFLICLFRRVQNCDVAFKRVHLENVWGATSIDHRLLSSSALRTGTNTRTGHGYSARRYLIFLSSLWLRTCNAAETRSPASILHYDKSRQAAVWALEHHSTRLKRNDEFSVKQHTLRFVSISFYFTVTFCKIKLWRNGRSEGKAVDAESTSSACINNAASYNFWANSHVGHVVILWYTI